MARILTFLTLVAVAVTHIAVAQHGPGSETSGLNAMVREIYAGSKLREFLHMFLDEPIPDMSIGSEAGKVLTKADGLYEQTFVSPAMQLSNGHIANKWLPIDWPHGHIAVKKFAAEVVKAGPKGETPPPTACCEGDSYVASREEVFMHHWTVNKWQLPTKLFKQIVNAGGLDYHLTLREKIGYIEMLAGAGLSSGANGPCYDSNLHLYFGIGNEVRTKTPEGKFPYEFPDPYGVEFNSAHMRSVGEFMVLNTHLIDIRGANNKRACTECKCSELGSHGFSNITEGGLTCCHSTFYDGGKCQLQTETPISNQTYYLRYTIQWRDFDEATKPLEVITFDATDNNTKWGDLPSIQGGFHESHAAMKSDLTTMSRVNDGRSGDLNGRRACHIEWFVPPCEDTTGAHSCFMTIRNSWELPYPIDIVFVRNHFHAGGVNMTTSTKGVKCIGTGTYDKYGNLVDVSTCALNNTGGKAVMHLDYGERLTVESVYKQDHLPHYGVMSMSFVYAHIPPQDYVQV